ncbi:hypothetical protein AcW1_008221 [Taiwanofungus camphoratus]|nr:hypothetical protein AcV5_008518 [Antrodia cinnamomea]KAI0951086.1 hypothetical protein AcW1_008221 [Antrodia cinnamomea]KAI0955980.1 hypothetical protein AcV7_006507 [Antrodia cinnamomea]
MFKVPFVLAAAFCNHISTTPPMPPPAPQELLKDVTPGERIFMRTVRSITALAKTVVWVGSICEVAVIFASKNPSAPLGRWILSNLVWGSTTAAGKINISSTFLFGWTLAVFGCFIRIACYHALGRLFTYELTVRKNHQLVTSGPYSIVRHPSYTGLIIGSVGTFFCHAGRGSWLTESGVLNTIGGKIVAYWWSAWTIYLLINLTLRTPQEDQVLKKEFGDQWEQWASRVSYRLIPGIY